MRILAVLAVAALSVSISHGQRLPDTIPLAALNRPATIPSNALAAFLAVSAQEIDACIGSSVSALPPATLLQHLRSLNIANETGMLMGYYISADCFTPGVGISNRYWLLARTPTGDFEVIDRDTEIGGSVYVPRHHAMLRNWKARTAPQSAPARTAASPPAIWSPAPSQTTPRPSLNGFTSVYAARNHPRYAPFEEILKNGRFLEGLSHALNGLVKVPQRVMLVAATCGGEDAFYDRAQKAIVLCYELIEQVSTRANRELGNGQRANDRVAGALLFILFHELGHALIDLHGLPITGREEDVADQISLFLLLNSADRSLSFNGLVGGVWYFGANVPLFFRRRHFADEHSTPLQRQFNFVCWAFGKDPSRFYRLTHVIKLPASRAQRCQDEYGKLERGVRNIIGDHLNASM